MSDFLEKLPAKTKLILAIGMAIALASLPSAIALVLINTGNLSYKSEDYHIEFLGKVRNQLNHTEYANSSLKNRLEQLDSKIKELEEYKKYPNQLPKKVEEVTKEYSEFKATQNEAILNSEKLTDYVEEAITSP